MPYDTFREVFKMKTIAAWLISCLFISACMFPSSLSAQEKNSMESRQDQLEKQTIIIEKQKADREKSRDKILKEILLRQSEMEKARESYETAYTFVLDRKWDEAARAFDSMRAKFPQSPWNDDSRFWQCYSMEKAGRSLVESFECYRDFIASYPQSKWSDDAKANLIRIGQALQKSGDTRYEAIIRSFESDEKEDVILSAITSLYRLNDDRALPALKKLMENNKNPEIREKALYMLGRFSTDEAANILIDIAKNDEDANIRGQAVIQLGRLVRSSPDMQFMIGSRDGAILPESVFIGQSTGRVERFNGENISIVGVQKTNDSGTNKKPVDPEKIVRALEDIVIDDSDHDIRTKALTILARIPDELGLPAVIAVAKNHPDYRLRKRAVDELGRSKDERARDALLEIIEEGIE